MQLKLDRDTFDDVVPSLMNTIKMPKNINNLQRRLPKAKYEFRREGTEKDKEETQMDVQEEEGSKVEVEEIKYVNPKRRRMTVAPEDRNKNLKLLLKKQK